MESENFENFHKIDEEEEEVIEGNAPVSSDSDPDVPLKKKHILEVIGNEPGFLHRAAAEVLQVHGVQEISAAAAGGGRGRSKARKSFECKSGQHNSQFVETKLPSSDVKVCIPIILKETCDFIREQIEVEGIFRKSGSSSRKQAIMDRLISLSTVASAEFLQADTVFDVCSVMKQFLREMSQPLIPKDLHNIFVSCLGLSNMETVAESILLAVFLLPLQNIHILCYLLKFLHEVAEHSDQNQMGARNLAVVIAPNIMPVEEKKLAKGIHQHYERIALDNHMKVVEILIENGELVGYMNEKFEKVLCANLLEEEGTGGNGRKKRRRSGSLTRVFGGIFWKGKSGKESEFQAEGRIPEFKTPGSHTPVIMGGGVSKKRQNDFTLSSNRRKKTILDSVRTHGMTGPAGFATPNSYIACPSPMVCLDPLPSPSALTSATKSCDRDKRSPSVLEWSNFYTPELFGKRRTKRSPESNASSAAPSTNGKFKTKLLFGRKIGKKLAAEEEVSCQAKLQKSEFTSSKMSIHRLARSPRAAKLVRIPSKIPVPEISPFTSSSSLRREPSVARVAVASGSSSESDGDSRNANIANATKEVEQVGLYVMLSETAKISDEKNEGFLASPTLLECSEEKESLSSHSHPEVKLNATFTLPTPSDDVDMEQSGTFLVSPPRWNLGTIGVPMAMATPELMDTEDRIQTQDAEDEFTRTLKESRIIELVSECKSSSRKSLKGLSFREKGLVSPSQKKIRSARRRRTHEVGRSPAEISPPRYMSLRSPRSRVTPPTIIVRSPSRCTLQRGRPNTMRAGLARPSSTPTGIPYPVSTSSDTNSTIDLVNDDENSISQRIVTLDRKGRIGRRNTCRPALPQVISRSKLSLNSFSTSTSPQPCCSTEIITAAVKQIPPPLPAKPSYLAGKLKWESAAAGNATNANAVSTSTPGKAARSFSMRDDLFVSSSKASPMRSYLLARSQTQRSGIPRYQFPGYAGTEKRSADSDSSPVIPMKRMLSVQEIVRRIECGQNENCVPVDSPKDSPSAKTNQFKKKAKGFATGDSSSWRVSGTKIQYSSATVGRTPSNRWVGSAVGGLALKNNNHA